MQKVISKSIGYSAVVVIIAREIIKLEIEHNLTYDLYEALIEASVYDNMFDVFQSKGITGIRNYLLNTILDNTRIYEDE